jgi:hypothetical protein
MALTRVSRITNQESQTRTGVYAMKINIATFKSCKTF